jgi:deazaflavin-dependent oxidoreductase (nitroreductase family)
LSRGGGRAERLGIRAIDRLHRLWWPLTRGRLEERLIGTPFLLLTTRGRRSGVPRTVALLATRDGDRLLLVGSLGGNERHPAWYLNLLADPQVEVELRGERASWTARVAEGEERAALWPKVVGAWRHYAAYQRRTDRQLPLVVLEKGGGPLARPSEPGD